MEQETNKTSRIFWGILGGIAVLAVVVVGIYSAKTLVSLKNEIAQKDQQKAQLEDVLGLRNAEVYTNTPPAELALIAPFGGSTASTTFTVNVETIVPPTPAMMALIEKGEKPKFEIKKESRVVNVTTETSFPVKKLSEFTVGELVKVAYRAESVSGAEIIAIRVEPYQVATSTPPVK